MLDGGTESCPFEVVPHESRLCRVGTMMSLLKKGWRHSPARRFRSSFQKRSPRGRNDDEPHRYQQRFAADARLRPLLEPGYALDRRGRARTDRTAAQRGW